MLAIAAVVMVGLHGYQIDRIQAFLDPWADPLGTGFHTIQGLLALGLGGIFGAGPRREPARGRPVPAERQQRLHLRDHRRGVRVRRRRPSSSRCSSLLAYAGIRTALRAPDTFGALLAAGITAWLCIQAFINIGVVVALLPVTGHHAAVHQRRRLVAGHQLRRGRDPAVDLARDRRTREPGTMRTADRGRRDGGTHLPGARRRALASRPSDRTRLTCVWVGGHRGLEASLVPAAGHPAATARAALAPLGRPGRPRSSSTRSASPLSVPQAAAPRPRAARGDLHDRRLRRDPDAHRGAHRCGIPVVLWDGNVIPGRSVRATARLADRARRLLRGDLRGARRVRPRRAT